jgi:hypothetical protein
MSTTAKDYQFTDLEREAYVLLHTKGWEAFEKEIGRAQADYLLNRWVDHKLARLNWINGAFEVHTYKKYAKGATITAYFATCNGRVVSHGFGGENLNRRVQQAYVNRNNAAVARRGDDSKPYAVLTVEFEPRDPEEA